MAVLNVKVPDEQKKVLEELAERGRYPSKSEYVREALRDKIERDLRLSEEVQERIEEARASGERVSYEEVKEDIEA